ncbi:FAD-dependent oxidoreductase [Sutterella sp.]|uniref:FAD-dependent oxidoreductase n=1 Tax=Sutterella sp. TaxID=1981025 RepID=UPI0026E0D2D5|nr:FAD-dependent oxidoreductase [Sutterella sp.]MDO5532724.1 FAD-dependent oxidoreductase [Sutterella sp.]
MTQQFSRRSLIRAGLASGATLAAAAVHAAPAGIYKAGTYSAKATGIAGDVIVTMTFSADRITDVVIDASCETPAIGQAAAAKLKAALMAGQTAKIDAVSGATVTSNAVSRAAEKCIAQAKGEIPVEVVTKSEVKEDDPSDWLGKPPEIAEKDIARTVETEIVVVGCGTAGMFAVAKAAEGGAKVIGIDRFAVGTGVREGFAAIGSRYQAKYGTKIDKFDFITLATKAAGGHVDQRLLRLFCDRSADFVNWYGDRLAERGVELWHETAETDPTMRYQMLATCHTARWPQARWESSDGKQKRLNGNVVLFEYAVKHGAEFHYNTKMLKLEREDAGRVTGLIAQDADGKYVRYVAKKGVVIATGGYCRNYAMLEALQPFNLTFLGGNKSMPGAMGDGIKACLWVGAKMDETHSMAQFDRSAIRPDTEPGIEAMKKSDMGTFWLGSQPWLKVNADGERFFNESGTYEGIMHSDENQKGHCHYSIFDSTWTDFVQKTKMTGCSRLIPHPNGARPIFAWQFIHEKVLPQLIKDGYVQQADTIEELAQKLRLPPAQLKATVERYNDLAAKGVDEDFGKEAFRLAPVAKPPYYGVKNAGYSLCTLDGIKINTHLNALDTKGSPIPGLYVVGNDSGGYFSSTYPNLVPGMCAGHAATFAYVVAEELAKA